MILRTIFFVCAFIVYPSMGKLNPTQFSDNFGEMCFQNTETELFRINGQETPLSNTLENFIAMAEKFEAANPSLKLKDELGYFISEYVYENIEITKGDINKWQINGAKPDKIDFLWDPASQGYKSDRTDLNVPFTDDEKCSLYYMISHSLIKKDSELLKSYSPRNISYEPRLTYSDTISPDDYFPQELGVVAIKGTDAAVSISKVLIGLYVGLDPNRKRALNSFENIQMDRFPDVPQDSQVDALYAMTLAEILMQSNWAANIRTGLAPNGQWVSIPLGQDDKLISGFCPMVYKQQVTNGELPAYSYSSVRGAADGLILGLSIQSIYEKKQNVKLSQILRMYYSPDGILLQSQAEDINVAQVSFCQRQGLIQSVESKLVEQMQSYGILVTEVPKTVLTVFNAAKKTYEQEQSKIYSVDSTVIRDYCDRPVTVDKPEDLPTETYLDVIVVLDSGVNEANFYQQQLIVGHLAKHLDLRYTGSRMTILLDQKISSGSGTSSKIELKPVVNDTSSSACAACMVGQIPFTSDSSPMEEDEVIMAINQLLDEKRRNDTDRSGVNGKVVIYFNYDGENGNNNKIQGKLQKALRELRMEHLDVLVYAVGLDPEMLKKYVKEDQNLVFLGTDGKPEDVAKKIFLKLSYAPGLLQYTDCKEARNEKAAIYENFVSPLTIQHYEMPAEYFYKSFKFTVNFESQNGYIKVCNNRRTSKPENIDKFCKNTTATTGIEFKFSNPCQSLTKETCSPLYFSIMGMNTVTEMRQDNRQKDYCNDINDHWCSNLNQIKYKVSHSGIRCSGCLGLSAPPAVILLAVLLSYILLKRF